MVKFQELKVTPNGPKLIIDASVIDLNYFNDVYIDSIIIDTQDTYTASGPSSKPLFVYEVPNISSEKGEKNVRLELGNELKVDFNKTLFFVYIITKGTPSPDTPCGMDKSIIVKATYNIHNYYRDIMYYLREMNNNCVIPKGFLDRLLRFKALEISIRTENYPLAIKYWNRFFATINTSNNINMSCGCNGRVG